MTGVFPSIPTPRRTTDEEDRVRAGVLRYVREAAERHAPLPGEMELSVTLGCSRQQLRHSLLELERSGVLRRRQGAATTVDPMALRMSVRMEEQFEHAELLSRMGYTGTVEVVSTAIEALPKAIAALLETGVSTQCSFTVKRWFADGVPAMVAEDRLALPTGFDGEVQPSVFAAAAALWGEPVIWEIATPGVVALDARMSALLDLPLGSPVLTLEQIGVSASGRRLFHTLEYHRPGLVSYSLVRTVRPPWSTV
ncbi:MULTISPECIES: GntR family transcriptional regulator [Subtercola]|uniref:GntR family transcriptional regulator n=1 Tax=Subtercola vilae TaxID=2056433 RepID=A0A4T2C1S4_9MICO|nr:MULTISPECIES: GntR family transcriptional regulator [Subtercola]MEA9985155.1 GntR family transcriptional regulator [Subtercola sp. RTI3]TIH37649.1 GntR family transcriptional regulator [Subtercola vilae]